MSDVIRFSYTIPPHYADVPDAVEYMEKNVRRQFGEALFDRLREHGGVVGPIHQRSEVRSDWLLDYTYVTMYARVDDLPDAPEFKMLGGPADGVIARTGGAPRWSVPLAPPMPTVANYVDGPPDLRLSVAEYERVGQTQTYRWVGTYDR